MPNWMHGTQHWHRSCLNRVLNWGIRRVLVSPVERHNRVTKTNHQRGSGIEINGRALFRLRESEKDLRRFVWR